MSVCARRVATGRSGVYHTALAVEDNGNRLYDKENLENSDIMAAPPRDKSSLKQSSKTAPAEGGGILAAEDSLRRQLEVNGTRTIAELAKEFDTLDGAKRGSLKNKQFAFAMSKV